jgi:hypothetical protein
MRTGITLILTLFLVLALAFTFGAFLAGQERPSLTYQTEIKALELETAAKMQAIKVGFRGGLAVIALCGAVGVTIGLVRAVWQRSRLSHPHANGLFPIRPGRMGSQTYYHDPNRQLAGSVTYGSGPTRANVQHGIPPDDQGEQLQVTTQAQATQLAAAAGQGQGLTAQSRRLVERVVLTTASRSAPRLPDVTILDEAIPEERHLLTTLRADWDK